jgi:hypothetical protein
MATSTPSLRRLWTMFKKLLIADGLSRRDQALSQAAFYAGARAILKVLGHLAERGDSEELNRVVRRHARGIRTLQGLAPRKRPH